MKKIIAFLFTLFFLTNLQGQKDSTKYKLKIKYNKKSNSKKVVPKSDSINIVFLYSYAKDIVKFKTSKFEFVTDTLIVDEYYGIAGNLKISKNHLKKRLKIYFNNYYIGALKVNRRYSSAHLEYNNETNIFTWRYHKYKFAFI
jgi:hypothetical protein